MSSKTLERLAFGWKLKTDITLAIRPYFFISGKTQFQFIVFTLKTRLCCIQQYNNGHGHTIIQYCSICQTELNTRLINATNMFVPCSYIIHT